MTPPTPSSVTRRLRVTVVNPFGVLGGAEQWLLDVLDHTERLDAAAVLLEDGPLAGALRDRALDVQVQPTGSTGLAVAGSALRLARTLRHDLPDVVLANGVKAAAVAVPAARLAGVRVLWAKHDFAHDATLSGPLGRWADGVVAVSAAVAEATGRTDVALAPPVAVHTPAPREEARTFWAERGVATGAGPTAAIVSRLLPVKGIDDAIRALADPVAAAWSLVVIGGDDPTAPGEAARLRQLATDLDVTDRVTFTGRVPAAARWLAAFDAVTVLTRTDSRGHGREGFGMTALEALRAGVPVVGVQDSPEVARMAALAGRLVPPGRPRAVAAALASLAEEGPAADPALAEHVADHPTAPELAELVASSLARCAGRPGAGRTDGPSVTVVTPALNESEQLDRVVRAVLPQLRDGDEYLLVEAGSDDDTPQRARAWADRDPRVTVLAHPGPSPLPAAAGRNWAYREAANDAVLCTDAGCVPAPDWVASMRTAFADTPTPDVVTGSSRVTPRTAFGRAVAAANYPDPDEAWHPGPFVRTYWRLLGRGPDATRPGGRNLAIRHEAWERAGGFPEHLDAAEEVTLVQRLAGDGAEVVLHLGAEVAWDPRDTVGATWRMWTRYGRGDGHARDTVAIARNLLRTAVYGAVPTLAAVGGRRTRALLGVGTLAYLSLPLLRAARTGPVTVLLVPAAVVVKDVGKAAGCLLGLAEQRGSSGTGPA